MTEVKLEASWKRRVSDELSKEYFVTLTQFIRSEYLTKKVYPAPANVFAAFSSCPFEKVNVVILGQDPYHGPHQANGLSFSVHHGVAHPPSLRNIFTEIKNDTGSVSIAAKDGDLHHWANQGVLLLNATLTVEAGKAGSHQGRGWEQFTDAVIQKISDQREHVVFILWGSYARKKKMFIDCTKHLVLESAHPSPLSAYAGFFGNKHFTQVNTYLRSNNKPPINW